MTCRKLIITADDYGGLEFLLKSKIARTVSASDRLDELQVELNRAQVVSRDDVPGDVVTMNSTVTLRDLETNELEIYTLVYPNRADIANHNLSVLSPIGTAILGYRVGDEVGWPVSDGWRRVQIEQIVLQPEREKAFQLKHFPV